MKIYIAALLLLAGSSLYAQKSAYLKAEAGFGRGTVRETKNGQRVTGWQPAGASRFGISGGVRVKKLSLEIGFGYGRTGGRQAETITRTSYINPDGLLTTVKATHRITHITLPISMGYDLRAGKRWSLQPRLGFEGAYMAGSKTEDTYVSDNTEALYRPLQQRALKPLSLHATGALQLHYRVTPGVEVYGGPSYRHMLTNGAAETLYTQPPYYKLRTSSTTFDVGVMLQLNRPKAAPKPSVPVGPQE